MYRIIAFCLLVSFLISSLNAQTKDEFYEQGNQNSAKGAHQEALMDFFEAIALDSTFWQAYNNAGRSAVALDSNALAVDLFKKALFFQPQEPSIYYQLAIAYQQMKYIENAILSLEEALTLKENYPEALLLKANLEFELKRYPAAIQGYSKLIKGIESGLFKETNSSTVYSMRAFAYRLSGNPGSALKDIEKALSINEKDVQSYYNRAMILSAEKKLELSIIDFSKAIELQPQHVLALYHRGMVYRALRQFKAAIKDFTAILKLNSKANMAYIARAFTFAELKKYTAALKDYSAVLKLDPNDAATWIRRGFVYQSMGVYENAWNDFDAAVKLKSAFQPYALNNRGNIKRLMGDLEESVADINQSLELDSLNSLAYCNRAELYNELDKYEASASDFEMALKLSPDEPLYLFKRAMFYYENNQKELALADLDKLQQNAPEYEKRKRLSMTNKIKKSLAK